MPDIVIEGLTEVESAKIEQANTPVDELLTDEVTLVFIAIDSSGSMVKYDADMRSCLADFKEAISNTKEADANQILIARADFRGRAGDTKVGGYKKVSEFDTSFHAGGLTPLYDVIVEGTKKLEEYSTFLRKQGMRVKSVFSVFSDGDDTSSSSTLADARASIEKLNNAEATTAFIAFGNEAMDIGRKLGFANQLMNEKSAGKLRQAFNCLSRSVIAASRSAVAPKDDFFQL